MILQNLLRIMELQRINESLKVWLRPLKGAAVRSADQLSASLRLKHGNRHYRHRDLQSYNQSIT